MVGQRIGGLTFLPDGREGLWETRTQRGSRELPSPLTASLGLPQILQGAAEASATLETLGSPARAA